MIQDKYHVKWEGYPEKDSTWEPIENLYSAMEKVEEYMAKMKKNKRGIVNKMKSNAINLLSTAQ